MMDNQDVNQNQIIDEGKSVDDAIQKGLERLAITKDEADIEILDEGSRGVLNLIGGKNARVVVRMKDDTSAVSAKVQDAGISTKAVESKHELEKIKEQIQNLQ